MKLFVFLGNPGDDYANTRHNAGWLFANQMRDCPTVKSEISFKGSVGNTTINSEKVIFLFPETFMNSSGEAVAAVSSYYKIADEDIYVFYDDIDVPNGLIRIAEGTRGPGGHNGIKSINQHVGNKHHRIRIGIGRPEDRGSNSIISWVLGKFDKGELPGITRAVDIFEEYYSDIFSKYDVFVKNVNSTKE